MAIAAATIPATARASDLFLNDEPEIYAAIDKLNASGYLPGFLANTRPYSIQAVRNAAERATRETLPEGFDADLLRWLTVYTSPKAMGRVTAAATYSDSRFLPPNNEGVFRPDDWSAQAGLSARGEISPYLSGQFRAATLRGRGDGEGNQLLDTSIEAGYKYAAVQVGKISGWYGPARHGSLLLTNNAAPYPGIRFHNPEPIPLTGWFSFLGNVQYELVLARMEKKPLFSHSFMLNARLAARPRPWLEIGMTRIFHSGGEGRDYDTSEFIAEYLGRNRAPTDRSNTLAGLDFTITLPFRYQPVQIYWDRAGEGDNKFLFTNLPYPSQWGDLVGVYLPKVFGSSRLDFRAEYADVYSGRAKTASWYNHSSYPHQYHGIVLGHPMGGGSKEWSLKSRYFFLPTTFAEVGYESVKHAAGVQPTAGFPGERRSRYSAGVTGWLTKSWRAEANAMFDSVSNKGGVTGLKDTGFSAFLGVSYQAAVLSLPGRDN